MPSFSSGDYVVHPGQGVCEITRVIEVETVSGPKLQYEMHPMCGPRIRICYPVDNESSLRKPVSKSEASRLIDGMPQLASDGFSDQHTWSVEEHFMNRLHHGDCSDVLCTVKTMYERIGERTASGKGSKACYERIFKLARERAFFELGLALDKSFDEVEQLVEASFARAAR